jgi:DNA-binding NtrC family response regulator
MMVNRVLVVERDVDLRSALRDMLEAEGCAVSEAPSFEGGLGILGRVRGVDLLLVNLGPRPRRAGPAIAALRAAAGCPVVAYSSLPRTALPHDLPVEGLLELPFTLGDLRRAIGWREGAAAPARAYRVVAA